MSSSTPTSVIDLTGSKRGIEEVEVKDVAVEAKKTKSLEVEVENELEVEEESKGGMVFITITNEGEKTAVLSDDGIFDGVTGYQSHPNFVTKEIFEKMNEAIRNGESGEESCLENMPTDDNSMNEFIMEYMGTLESVDVGHVASAFYVMYYYF